VLERRARRLLWGLAAVAVVFRLGAFLHPGPLGVEEALYLVAAHHLDVGLTYSAWRGPETHVHPLHPWLVSVIGNDPASLEVRGRTVAFVCSVLLLWPLGALTHRLGGPVAAAAFLLMAGLHPWLVRAASLSQPESVYDLMAACGIALLLRGLDGAIHAWRWIAAGMAFGLSYLARPEGILVGSLVGLIAFFGLQGGNRRALAGLAMFGVAMLLVSSPFLLFLKRETGSWMVTGKTTELFFVGQAVREGGAEFPVVRGLMERWKGILPYVVANPWIVCRRALHQAAAIGGWVLPMALGPPGLLGLVGVSWLAARRKDLRAVLGLLLSPCLTLILMLLTYTNRRVIGSVLPFIFAAAALGLAAWARDLSLENAGRRIGASAGLVVCVLLLWTPTLARMAKDPTSRYDYGEIVALAVRKAGGPERVASNNPALSFMVGDPRLLAPAGSYHPLPWTSDCTVLTDELARRRATVAILDRFRADPVPLWDPGTCGLRVLTTLEDPIDDRRISVIASE
jgi:Dolichyl-phosphate-mannose-protein mannosyltransferase